MGGPRESMKNQKVNLARNATKLISNNLKYPNSKPVQCILADSTIGGNADAIHTNEKFTKEGIKISLLVTPRPKVIEVLIEQNTKEQHLS